ncbi:MAG: hypothetical protein FWC91_10655 [Defluviitaleaceae bacterium]|nr:hypothetical protein [Defluviitaleaceae bacterium]
MNDIIYWINNNREWFFSGLGVFLLSIVGTYFFKRKNNHNKANEDRKNEISGDNNWTLIGDQNTVLVMDEAAKKSL